MKWWNGLSWVWRIATIVAGIVALVLAYHFVDDLFSKNDEVQATIATNQTDAAIKSGKDTVTTITTQFNKETDRTTIVHDIQKDVNNAQDAHAAHTAGADGLCVNFDICTNQKHNDSP